MRARGWGSSFPIGSQAPGPGVPLISAFQWDTGVQASWRTGSVELAGSVTNGTLSNPRVRDDNGGKQFAGRVARDAGDWAGARGVGARGVAWLSRIGRS